ncbi:MAG: PfkB family carbohydrate kinase [Candidatus Aenigmarchaeota archaeon]|nr:PfkB family carbohydrate kinase [Candidatus Aenigmarchaeota archaeon]
MILQESLKEKGDSSICVCLLDENKNRTLCVFPSTVRELTIDEVLGKVGLDWTFDTKFLHLTSMVGDTSFETQKYVVKNTPSHVKISFDPGMLYAERGLDALLPIIEKSYVIFANDKEIERITGKNYERGVKELLKYSEIVACKLGEEGSKVFYNDKEIYTPITKVEVVDTTGAGDVYDAGFLAGLLLNKSLNECAQLATEAASLSITDYGRKRYPDSTLLRRYGWA